MQDMIAEKIEMEKEIKRLQDLCYRKENTIIDMEKSILSAHLFKNQLNQRKNDLWASIGQIVEEHLRDQGDVNLTLKSYEVILICGRIRELETILSIIEKRVKNDDDKPGNSE